MPGWPTSMLGRGVQLVGGLLVASVGIWLTIRAGLGVASWEVLHIALAERSRHRDRDRIHARRRLPRAARRVSSAYDPGVGTVLNVLVIGLALNLLLATPLLATLPSQGLAERLLVLAGRDPRLRRRVRGLCGRSPGPGAARRAHAGPAPEAARSEWGPRGWCPKAPVSASGGCSAGPPGSAPCSSSSLAGPSVALAFRWLRLRPLPGSPPLPRPSRPRRSP